jgi:hypothetical protein
VAARPRRAHAPPVPLRRDLDDDGPVQPGLPGVLPEEAPLPSEVVLDGGTLDRRRREALAAIRASLLERPDGFEPEEWRVVVATLAPPTAHLGRRPGTAAARYGVVQTARDCFPHLGATQAVARFREAQGRPHVAAFVADMRALELIDVLDQRGPVRERLWQLIRLADAVDPAVAVDPDAGSNHVRAAAVAVQAIKVLVDMDALHVTPAEVAALSTTATSRDDDVSGLPDKVAAVARVAEDLRARRREPAGV